MTVPCNQLTVESRQYGHRMSRTRRRVRHQLQFLFIAPPALALSAPHGALPTFSRECHDNALNDAGFD